MMIVLVVLALVVMAFVGAGVKIVLQAEVMVIERFGRFDRIAKSGLNIIVPFFDKPRQMLLKREGRYFTTARIDIRERVMGFEKTAVITHDNVGIQVGSVIYYQIIDPVKALYEVQNVDVAIEQLVMTNLRNIMGGFALDETLTSRETVNNKLRMVMDEATEKWGVKVTRVELREIEPPQNIVQAMNLQMTAERERRAEVTKAEGDKAAAILQAEGEKQSKVLQAQGTRDAAIAIAEGEKQAKILAAQATAEQTRLVYQSIHDGKPDAALLTIKYLETLQTLAQGSSNKVFVPFPSMDVLGAVGAVTEALAAPKG